MGYPESAGGLFTSGGSAANLLAVVAAREAAGNPRRAVVYLSDQAHGSVERAARIAGVDPARIRVLATDDEFRIVPATLLEAARRDREAGLEPFCLVANAGTTNTGAMARDVTRLESAFRILPDYMQDTDLGTQQVNFCNRGIQLTRAFRALRVWLSVQRYGLAAHRQAIAGAMGIAAKAADRIGREDELELLAPPSLGIVCFRYRGPATEPPVSDERLDELNRRIQDRIVQSGFAMIASTRLGDRFSLRFCVLNTRTTEDDVMRILDRVLEIGRRLRT